MLHVDDQSRVARYVEDPRNPNFLIPIAQNEVKKEKGKKEEEEPPQEFLIEYEPRDLVRALDQLLRPLRDFVDIVASKTRVQNVRYFYRYAPEESIEDVRSGIVATKYVSLEDVRASNPHLGADLAAYMANPDPHTNATFRARFQDIARFVLSDSFFGNLLESYAELERADVYANLFELVHDTRLRAHFAELVKWNRIEGSAALAYPSHVSSSGHTTYQLSSGVQRARANALEKYALVLWFKKNA